MAKKFTVKEAAEILSLSKIQVNKLVQKGIIHAKKEGNQFMIDAWAIASYELVRKEPGRPRKNASTVATPFRTLALSH